MNRNTPKNDDLRGYLLGKIDSEAREKIEDGFMTDEAIFQELEIEEDELIRDYVSKKLTVEDEKLFYENFLISDERRENLRFERALLQHAEKSNFDGGTEKSETREEKKNFRLSRFYSFSLAGAAGFAVLVLMAFVIWKGFLQNRTADDTLNALNKAYQKERPFGSRISGFNYAPANNLRGGDKKAIDSAARDDAFRLSRSAVEQSPTAKNLHSFGVVYLSEKEFDKAVEQLKQAAALDPQNAEISNDLGTAYLEKGKMLLTDESGKSFDLFAQALEQFEKSLVLNPALQEAQFNKAICLTALKQTNQAQEAWQNYLKMDEKSSWADEARRNLEMLQTENSQVKHGDGILSDFMRAFEQNNREQAWQIMSRNREMITGKLVPQQLAGLFLRAKDEKKGAYLAALKYAGELEKENSKDDFFAEIGNFYSAVPEEKIADLTAAQNSIKKGFDLCQNTEYEPAAAEFANAHALFEKSGDQWEARLADYWIAYANFQSRDKIPESAARFESLLKFAEEKKYKWLESIVLSRLSINSSSTKQFSKTIEYAKKSLELAEQTSDLYLKQKLLSLLANEYQLLGRYDESLIYLHQSFELLDYPETSSRQKWRTFSESIRPLITRKYYLTAENVIKESIALNDKEIDDKTFTHLNSLQLSRVYGKLGNYTEALKYADLGISSAENLLTEKTRTVGRAAANLNLGKLQSEKGDCQNAVNSYSRAIETLDSTKYSFYSYDAYKSRLLCYFQLGDDAAIKTELPAVLKIFESNRTQIVEEQNRNNFFDNENDIYDLAVGYEYDKKNYEQAFNYSEESRARSLLDLQKNGAKLSFDKSKPDVILDEKSVQPRGLAEIQAAMPDEAQILEYTVLPDKILIWSVTKNNFQYFSREISESDLEKKIASFAEAIINNEPENQKNLARELYEILVSPSAENLDGTKEICLIPDKSLIKLPFAALISNKTGNYFFADYKLLAAPSANVFLASTENAQKRNQEQLEKLLSVGNPEFDKREFPDLPELPAAKKEAKEIAALYERPTVLLEKEVTKEKLRTAISEADIFHFAGHYISDDQSPLLSAFLVSGTDGKLTNYELLEGKFRTPKLIILSACRTGIENYYRGEGMIGAGRTFLASGVPLVVGSLWEVDSDSTAELMEKFHYYRKKENLSTVSALQQAQLEMLKSPHEKFRQPFYWAGFLTIGGHARF